MCGYGILWDIYLFGLYSLQLACLGLGQGNAMKTRTDNECVLYLVLIGLQVICHTFFFEFLAM